MNVKRRIAVWVMILCLVPLGVWAEEENASALCHIRENGLWGYTNEQAEWIIPPQYDNADNFRDGLALVEKKGKLMYMDRSGAAVWEER